MIILALLVFVVALFFTQNKNEAVLTSTDTSNKGDALHSELDDIEREIDILTSAEEPRSIFGLESLERDLTNFTDRAFKEFEL